MTDAIRVHPSRRKRQFAGLVLRVIRNRFEIWRATRRLDAFDDAMLKDIGISRSDIERVTRHGRPPRQR
jgi:uncharacterized protein YjiS (DUF1127 family)